MLRNALSHEVLGVCLSDPFAKVQETKQGSICAPLLYMVFVNGLLEKPQAFSHELKIGDVSIAAPTQANYIVFLSQTRSGPQRLVNSCHDYATRWRYTYNPY